MPTNQAPDQFRHPSESAPIATTHGYSPQTPTSNPLANAGLNMLTSLYYQKAMLPPVHVGGMNPTDIWYMNYHGNQLREEAQRTSLMNGPMIQQLESTLQGTKYSGLVNQLRASGYAGSELQRQLLSHEASQIFLGGNIPLGAGQLLNSAGFLTRGVGPISNMTEMTRAHQDALALTSGMNRAYIDRLYQGSVAPDPAYLMGFRAEARMQVAATMMGRGDMWRPGDEQFRQGVHYNVAADGSYDFTSLGQARASRVAGRVEGVMKMLSSGRQVFGDMDAPQMLAATENFFGMNTTGFNAGGGQSQSVAFRSKLQEFAALARAVGMDAQELVSVKSNMESAIAAVSGGGLSESTIKARGFAAAENFARTAKYLETEKGGPLGGRERAQLEGAFVEFEANTARSTGSRGARIMSLMAASGKLSATDQEAYTAALQRGDRFSAQSVMRRVSETAYGDPRALTNALHNEAASNLLEEGLTSDMRAKGMDNRDIMAAIAHGQNSVMTMAVAERRDRFRVAEGNQLASAALRRARRGGIRLDSRTADAAAVGAMVDALDTEGFLAGVSSGDKEMIGRQMEEWKQQGMTSGQIMRAIDKSELFQLAGVDSRRFSGVAAAGRGESMASQLADNTEAVITGRQARYVLGMGDPKSQAAKEARRKINSLLRAGRVGEAEAEMKKFEETHLTAEQRGDADVMKKRIAADETGKITRLKEKGVSVDPVLASKFGTQNLQERLSSMGRATAGDEDLDDAVGAQLREGDAIEEKMNTSQTAALAMARKAASDIPAKKGWLERFATSQTGSRLIDPTGALGMMSFFMGGDKANKQATERTLESDKSQKGSPIEVVIVQDMTGRGGVSPASRPPRRRR